MKKILFSVILAAGVQTVGAQNLVPQQAQTIIYVKPDGTGNGSSWSQACDLECISRSSSNTQIWVQKGTYYPSVMLFVPNSVKMYGGFEGDESNLSQRDSLSNSTIIDAQQQFGSVVRLGVSTELNGFVIQNGYANDNPHINGGGVFADDNSIIANCLVINNAAAIHGGGVYSKGTVKIINSTIQDNIASGNGNNIFGNCLTWSAGSGLSSEVSPINQDAPASCTAPTISLQPSTTAQSKVQKAEFPVLSVSATGTAPLIYRWYSNETNNTSIGTLVGVTSSYTPSSATVGSLYHYCVVSNACGSATSNVSGLHTVTAPIVATGCASGTFNFGTVSFASATTRTITGNGITQVWSDAVTATGCQKTAFNGGSSGAYRIDCRSNPSYPGDLFSWCAVAKYASTLCPAPWRVPTEDDFINLDKALAGPGSNRTGASSELPKYTGKGTNQWGGAYGGFSNAGSLSQQGSHAYYWSQTEYLVDRAYYLYVDSTGYIYPHSILNFKQFGFPLRCVR